MIHVVVVFRQALLAQRSASDSSFFINSEIGLETCFWITKRITYMQVGVQLILHCQLLMHMLVPHSFGFGTNGVP